MTIDQLTEAIEGLYRVTHDAWEDCNPDVAVNYDDVQEVLDDVTARLVLRYAERRAEEEGRHPTPLRNAM